MKTLKFMLAAATAIGLASATQADQYNTTGFEKLTVGDPVTTGVQDNRSGYSYFYYAGSVAEDNESVIAAGTPDIARPRGAASVDATQNNILQVSTGTDPLLRTYQGFTGSSPVAATTLEGDVYVDTLVQFTVTPYTDTVTPGSADKLMIYLKESTNEVNDVLTYTTNLVVVGKYHDVDSVVKEYKVDGLVVDGVTTPTEFEPNKWYRLTVKVLQNVATTGKYPGFMVYIDGKLCVFDSPTANMNASTVSRYYRGVDAVTAKQVVLSLLADGTADASLQGVGFAGEGKVDDIVFGTVDPFATVFDFTFAFGTGVSAVTYTVGGVEYDQARTFPEVEAGTEVEITSVTYADDYMAGSTTAVNLSDPVEGVYSVTNAGASLTITPAEAYAKIGDTKYGTFADAAAGATAGSTLTLLRDATGAKYFETAAGTLDLNGKKLFGTDTIKFTGSGATTITGGEIDHPNVFTITNPANAALTLDGVTFHASVTPIGSGGVLFVTNCDFKVDVSTDGKFTNVVGKTYHSYGILFNAGSQFTRADVVDNRFDQGRRAAIQASYSGDLYFYGNTVDGSFDSTADGDMTGAVRALYPALQIFSNGRVIMENNTFTGQYLGEAFCIYNKGAYRSTDAAVVFSGNTVDNNVTYLWGIYDVDKSGTAALTNNVVYFGANTIGANVNTTQCVYKAKVDGVDMNGVTYSHTPANLALPTGVATVYDWTHAAGATDFYVNDTATASLSALVANAVVLAVPGADVSGASLDLTPDATYKNKWTAKSSDSWNTPSDDASVADSLEDDGFPASATNLVTSVSEFNAFVQYITNKVSGAAAPADLTEYEKANAALCYALNATAIPDAELTDADVTIDSIEKNADGSVALTVAIKGVTVGETVAPALLAKVVTAKGGTELGSLSSANVTVNGYGAEDGKVVITVEPAQALGTPTSFFMQTVINK